MKFIICLFFILNQIVYSNELSLKLVDITSSIDNTKQKAFIYLAKKKNRPLIISLHSWSGNYKSGHNDSLAKFAIEQDINYIYPDFRGSNDKYDACCSRKVITDIDDAISYMKNKAKINENEISVVGVSGGGMATLCYYFNTKHKNIKQFISFSAMTNLFHWYRETIVQGSKYSKDIQLCTELKENELKNRSPVFAKLNELTFDKSQLYIMHGIHDGHHGSVPVSHAFGIYNSILKKDKADDVFFISNNEQKEILKTQKYEKNRNNKLRQIGDRKLWFFKDYKNVHLRIFEGYHEMIDDFVREKVIKSEYEK